MMVALPAHRRIAAAFEVRSWHHVRCFVSFTDYIGRVGQIPLWCRVDTLSGEFTCIEIGTEGEGCKLFWEDEGRSDEDHYWALYAEPKFHEIMARGLYRLGFEDEGVLSQLPSLTAHERMEARLTLARQFWPPQWEELPS